MERAAMDAKEMEFLLDEIPHATSPQHHQDQEEHHGHHCFHQQDDDGCVFGIHGIIYCGGRGRSSFRLSEASSSSSRTSSSTSPMKECSRSVTAAEDWIVDRLQAIHIRHPSPETPMNGFVNPYGFVTGTDLCDPSQPNLDWVSDLVEPPFSPHPYVDDYSLPNPVASPYYSSGLPDGMPSRFVSSPSQKTGFESHWDMGGQHYMPVSSQPMTYPELNPKFPILGHHVGQLPEEQSAADDVKSFAGDDSFIIQGKDVQYDINNPIRPYGSLPRSLKYDCLTDVQGYMYFVAKDQQGCRFLQRKLDEQKPEDVAVILKELIDHAAELMVNPFANYLMQKIFEVCTEEQRLRIILGLTERPFELVQISLNNHGTRAVQKLIETLQTRQQINMVVSALQPGFLILIKDLNGHHVIQRCLQFLSTEYNKFIFDAATRHCVNIATDQHGCCVLQRCIVRSTGEYWTKLVMKISSNGLLLSQHPFGNYAVQFIMDLNNPMANGILMSQFKGNFVELSRNKFSSNVVEKCLKIWEDARKVIVLELLSTPNLGMLLQHQYANYVIQRALSFSKGPLRDALVNAIQPHAPILRTSPYCKKIFSKPYFKKCTSY